MYYRDRLFCEWANTCAKHGNGCNAPYLSEHVRKDAEKSGYLIATIDSCTEYEEATHAKGDVTGKTYDKLKEANKLLFDALAFIRKTAVAYAEESSFEAEKFREIADYAGEKLKILPVTAVKVHGIDRKVVTSYADLIREIPGGVDVLWEENSVVSRVFEQNGEAMHEEWGKDECLLDALFHLYERVREASEQV